MRIMQRVLLCGASSGCGIVLTTPQDDNFDCGAVIDTTGGRFPGATGWTLFDSATSRNLVDGRLEIKTSSNGIGFVRRGAVFPCPAGDFEYVTDCEFVNNDLFDGGVGLMLYENTTNKWICPVYGFNFGLYVAARTSGGTNYGITGVSVLKGKLKMARTGTTLTAHYDNGLGWTSLMSVAQTVDFTVAPTHVGVFSANSVANNGPNFGYFEYFLRTV